MSICVCATSTHLVLGLLVNQCVFLIKLASAVPEKDIEMLYFILCLNVHLKLSILKIFQVDSSMFSKIVESPIVRQPLYLVTVVFLNCPGWSK